MAGFNPSQPRDQEGQWTKAEQSARENSGLVTLSEPETGKLFKKIDIVKDGTKVGYIQYKVKKGLYVNEIFVSPEARRQGIATAAIKNLMNITNTDFLEPTVLTESGKKLYESFGA